jgi:hypothetical protein
VFWKDTCLGLSVHVARWTDVLGEDEVQSDGRVLSMARLTRGRPWVPLHGRG